MEGGSASANAGRADRAEAGTFNLPAATQGPVPDELKWTTRRHASRHARTRYTRRAGSSCQAQRLQVLKIPTCVYLLPYRWTVRNNLLIGRYGGVGQGIGAKG